MITIFRRRQRTKFDLNEVQSGETLVAESPVHAEIARHLPLLKVLGTQVQETARQVEDAVVGVCSTFHLIAEQARTGVARASSFLSGHSIQNQNIANVGELIGQARGTFDSLLRTLTHGAEVSRQAVRRMQEIDRHAEKIRGALKNLEEIGDGNRILALNARIEAAHAGAYGKGFEAVATEVIAQTDRSRAVIDEVSQTIQSLRATASSALSDLTHMSQQGLASAAADRSEVERTLEAFNDVDQQMRSLLQAASEDSIRLSDEINRAVRGMQFQDRVNQRLSHVADALSESHARLSGVCGDLGASDPSLVENIMSRYTMHEERSAADRNENEAAAGEVELF